MTLTSVGEPPPAITRLLLNPWTARGGLVLLLLAVWQWATATEAISPLVLPPPLEVGQELVGLIGDGYTWQQVGITSLEVVLAFAIATVAGLLIGAWTSRSRRLADLAATFAAWGQLVPLVVVYPVFLLSMGIGPASKVAYAAVLALFPVVLATVRALQTVDPRYKTVASSLGASRFDVFWNVELPAARHGILTGIRVGAALSLIGVILGEMLGSSQGIGAAITASGQSFNTTTLYAYILFTLVITLVFNALITRGAGGDTTF
jgi:ABC-type nitrate/sulfonate/bicarbonate transport system permease component